MKPVPVVLAACAATQIGIASAAARHGPVHVVVKASDHSGHGELVLEMPRWDSVRQGLTSDGLVLRFKGRVSLRPPQVLPRNVVGWRQVGEAVLIRIAPGAQPRTYREGRRLVVDMLDPPPPPATPIGPTSPPVAANPAAPASLALAVAATHAAGADPLEASILLPFASGVGAAALRRGDQLLVVFDAARPLDLAALRDDPVFASADLEVLPDATLLRLHPPADMHPVLTREPAGWRLALGRDTIPFRAIETTQAAGALAFAAADPGRVVAIPDPLTGATLLIGTQRSPGQAMLSSRQTPEFALLRTVQGIAVEPLSDRLILGAAKAGFRLSGAGGALALAPRTMPDRVAAEADALSRRFALPSGPTEALAAEVRDRMREAADAPPLGRGRPRVNVAKTLIALGMAREAQGALRAAGAADPHLAEDPTWLGLSGIAAVLADDPEAARALFDPRLTGTDEVALWRSLRDALGNPSPASVATLAATAPLLLRYPAAVRQAVLPLALETLETHGESKAAAPILLARLADPRLALARAMQAEADGKVKDALAGYDALANGHDRYDHARAALRAVDLRLAQKQITPAQGIAALERLDMAWRGDATELAVRERLAGMHLQTGAWQKALALLRSSLTLFPDQAPDIHARMTEAVRGLLRDDKTRAMPPLDFVALLEENADLLGDAAKGPEMQARLADRLLALDLPDAAAPLLERLMREAPPDAGRAAIGARLAAIRLAAGDGAGALAALSASQADSDLPPTVTAKRALLSAEATARTGDVAGAVTALTSLNTEEADRARADIEERAGDKAGELAALTPLADRIVPASGSLDTPARHLLLRMAAVATGARDEAAIEALRTRIGNRLDTGEGADAIRLLLAPPVSRLADIARSGTEAALAGVVVAHMAASPPPPPH